ncbi:hypothetical protein [Rhizorhabdus phycosphaerae]|uniref:hypothetical protein n=1 Tax=Rhizorhabdus phycosphaerae TaxID=2711156 RepID=UPI0013EBB024|nr:hypothetical protein [Rhizorhabdus phycosphaerae]
MNMLTQPALKYKPPSERRASQMGAWRILWPALLGLLSFWIVLAAIAQSGSMPGVSMSATIVSALIGWIVALLISVQQGTIDSKLAIFGIAVLLLRIAIGIGHYFFWFDLSYFDVFNPSFQFSIDYEALSQGAAKVSDFWNSYGFAPLPSDFFDAKNSFLYPYFGLLFFIGGNEHFLNFGPFNALHNCLVALIAARFTFRTSGRAIAQIVFVIVLMQPFGIISTIQWRDSVGQFFLVAGGVLCILASPNLKGGPSLLLGAFSMMALRNVYFVNAIITFATKLVSSRKLNAITLASTLVIGGSLLLLSLFLTNSIFVYDLGSGNFSFNRGISRLLYDMVRGLSGPFPWTQMLDPSIGGREFFPEDVLQATFHLSATYLLWKSWRAGSLKLNDPTTLSTLVFFGSIMGAGLISYGHVTYVTVSTVLILPFIAHLTIQRFYRVFVSILLGLIAAGATWSALGLSSAVLAG